MDGTFLSLDTETTGLSFGMDRVIEFGCTVFVNWKAVHSNSFTIYTDVPNGAFEINGIDPNKADFRDQEYAFTLISLLMHKYPRRIIAYNAYFDLMFLAHEFRRHNIVYDFTTLTVVDPLIIFRQFRPYQRHKLMDACGHYKVDVDNFHGAKNDSLATGLVLSAQRLYHGLHSSWTDMAKKCSNWNYNWCQTKRGYLMYPYAEEYECFPVKSQSELELPFLS